MALKCICGCDWAIHDFLGRCNSCPCRKNQLAASAALGEIMIDPQTVERVHREAEEKQKFISATLNQQIQQLTDQKNGAYTERDKCVALLARLALDAGMRVGLAQHPAEDTAWDNDWRTIVFIDLPTGQVSWHIHDSEVGWFQGLSAYDGAWDGHTTPEKYERVLACASRAR